MVGSGIFGFVVFISCPCGDGFIDMFEEILLDKLCLALFLFCPFLCYGRNWLVGFLRFRGLGGFLCRLRGFSTASAGCLDLAGFIGFFRSFGIAPSVLGDGLFNGNGSIFVLPDRRLGPIRPCGLDLSELFFLEFCQFC